MKVTGKLKTEEVIEVEVSDTHYSVKVKALESDNKKKSKKSDEDSSFGEYSNDFSKDLLEAKGIKKLPDGRTKVSMKFAGEKRKFVFVSENQYEDVVDRLQ